MANKPFYPVGRYACKVISQALGEAGTGNPQFALRFQVMGLVDPADPTRFIPGQQQYERTYYRTITEKTIDYFLEDLKALGFTGSSFKELDPATPNFHDFKGLDIDMWCAHENAQDGGEREKWSVARQGGELTMNPIDPKKVRDLDNLFGKQLKSLKAAAPAPQQRAPEQAAATPVPSYQGVDEDVPF